MKDKIKPFHWWSHTKEQRNTFASRWFDRRFGNNTGYGIYNKILEVLLCADGCITDDEIDLYASDICTKNDQLLREALDFGVSKGIFYKEEAGYRSEFIDGVYVHGLKLSENMKREPKKEPDEPEQANTQAKPQAKPKAKAEPEPEPEQAGSPAAQKILDTIAGIVEDAEGAKLGNAKNRGSNFTAKQIDKLIALHGLKWLENAIKVYFRWKLTTTKAVKSDYLSIKADWVAERVGILPDIRPAQKTRKELLEEYND